MSVFIRLTILFILNFIYRISRPFLHRKEIVILMYHSISDSGWFFSVRPNGFERQIKYLKSNFNVVRLGEIIDYLEKKRDLPSRSVVVTFDDGYEDFYKNAFPILKKYGIPATVFIIAEEPDRKELGSDFKLLSWEQIKEIISSGLVDIGSHGLTHKKLTRISIKEVENEVARSRVVINDNSGFKPLFFAYPKGSFNKEIKKSVEQNDYAGAVTAEQMLVLKNSDPYAIPRIQVDRSRYFFEFKARLTSVANWYYWLWRKFNT